MQSKNKQKKMKEMHVLKVYLVLIVVQIAYAFLGTVEEKTDYLL